MRGLSLPDRMLRPESLMRAGGGAQGVVHFEAIEPLRLLLEDCRRHARLNLAGCFAARFDTLRLIRNVNGMLEREAREPAVLTQPIERPIFITGLPRSGTTFLHKLLAEDPENRSPAVWETILPLPRHRWDSPARRMATVRRQLAAFERMAPNFRAVHPLDATSPQECTEIKAHVFRSFRFESTYNTPAYRLWLREADRVPAYRFHRRFLQHLQHSDGRPRRWVLKSPDHVFTLEALSQVYPDARLIVLHRDPVEVLASVAGLTAILREPFTARLDRVALGRQVADDWVVGAEAIRLAHAARLFPEERIAHLHFADLTQAPLAAVSSIYARFGLTLTDEVRAAM
ncbi:MAG: sulfotransferase [Roseococcus sp.]